MIVLATPQLPRRKVDRGPIGAGLLFRRWLPPVGKDSSERTSRPAQPLVRTARDGIPRRVFTVPLAAQSCFCPEAPERLAANRRSRPVARGYSLQTGRTAARAESDLRGNAGPLRGAAWKAAMRREDPSASSVHTANPLVVSESENDLRPA